MTECGFCEDIQELKAYWKRHEEPDVKQEYRVCLIEETYVGGNYRGRAMFKSTDITFCPCCGRNMKNTDEPE